MFNLNDILTEGEKVTQQINITDTRNNEQMSMTFPQHYVPQILSPLQQVISGMMNYFTIHFDPGINIDLHASKKKLIILAAIAAAIEEGYI